MATIKNPLGNFTVPAQKLGMFTPQSESDIVKLGGDPSVPSLAYMSSLPDWTLIRDILAGTRTIRARGELYLPRNYKEPKEDFDWRLAHTPFVNVFKDSVQTIASKPFSKEVVLQGDIEPEMRQHAEDIDGHGTSLHKFARDVFEEGASFGLVGCLVDFPFMTNGMTLEDERRLNPRPYWVWYRPEDVLALYTEVRAGRRYVIHVRLREDTVRRMGYTERPVKRVRVLDDDGQGNITWQLWEQGGNGWALLGQGNMSPIKEIPFRLLKFGKRDWWNNATIPPLIDLAYLNIEHYQQTSNLKRILNLTAFPMLAGMGVEPQVDETGATVPVEIGPNVVLFAPIQPGLSTFPEWKFIEPGSHSMKVLQDQIGIIEAQMSKIGMSPLIRNKGGITATSEAVNSSKAHAAAESWASDEKDQIEQLWVFHAQWMGLHKDKSPQVYIHTDFGVELKENAENTELLSAAQNNALSRRTLWDEWQRRGFLGPQFDPIQEEKRLDEQYQRRIYVSVMTPQIDGAVQETDGEGAQKGRGHLKFVPKPRNTPNSPPSDNDSDKVNVQANRSEAAVDAAGG